MRKAKRLYVFLFFVCLGIGIGVFIRFEDWAVKQLVSLIADEVKDGTGCELQYERASFSILRLLTVAKNVDVVCPGNVIALHFDEITVVAGLRKIFSLIVTLDDIRLKNGYAQGISPKSATYRFIDYLAKPSSPERQKQTRIRVELISLTVSNTKFFEPLGKNMLMGEGFSLKVGYNEQRDVLLTPRIEKLTYVMREKQITELPLGVVTGDVQITDDDTLLNRIDIQKDENKIHFSGKEAIKIDNSLQGKSSFTLALSYLGIPDWLGATITGQTDITGELGSPVLTGNFSLPAGETATVSPGGSPIVTFDTLTSELLIDVNDGEPIVTLSDIKGESEGSTLESITPLQIKDGNLIGSLKLTAKKISVGPVTFNNTSSTLDLSGPLGETVADFKGNVETIETLGATVRGVSFTAKSKDEKFNVEASHSVNSSGKIILDAVIDVTSPEPLIQSSNFTLTNYPILALYRATLTNDEAKRFLVSGTGSALGSFDAAKVSVSMNGVTSSPLSDNAPLDLQIENGALNLSVKDSAGILTSSLKLGLTDADTKGTLSGSYVGKDLERFKGAKCSNIASSVEYAFSRGALLEGTGAIKLDEFSLGCGLYAIQMAAPSTIPIANGSLDFSKIALKAFDNAIGLTGHLKFDGNVDLGVNGKIPLRALESIVPSVDELSGITDIALRVSGNLAAPVLAGRATLLDGLVAFEKSEILLEKLRGDVVLSGDSFTFQNFQGRLNGGEVALTGKVFPFKLEESSVQMNLQGAAFSPASGLSFLSDAALSLVSRDQRPFISGEINITSADFEKKLDIVTLARQVTRLLFESSKPLVIAGSAPDIPLEIKVIANRNIFAVTNYFGAELKADLDIRGSLAKPNIVGSVESLSGWFGLRERRFDLTSGTVRFLGADRTPELSVIGESLVRSSAGDMVNVYLEASGLISEPKVTFSSDTGLSQQSILTLLTSTGQTMQQTAVNTIGSHVQVGGVSLLEDIPILSYSSFLRYLGQVDSISIEPQFNIQTGLIEPTVSATKKLTDYVYLLGQGYLGSQTTETRVGVVYNLLPYLNVAGFFTNATYQKNVALEINSTLTVLAQQKKFVNVSVSGNRIFDTTDVLRSVRLFDASRVPPEEMERIRQGIRRFYRQRGYFETRILSRCVTDGEYCREIELTITEGERSTINSLVVDDSVSTDASATSSATTLIDPDLIPNPDSETIALTAPLVEARDEILSWLRNEGFISARVEATYEKTPFPLKRDMVYKITRGRPVTFFFEGNKAFSAKEFLETINLFKRKVPFGNNTVNILRDNIEQLYREEGYLDVNVRTETNSSELSTPSDTARISHTITIEEGEKYQSTRAELVGISETDKARVQKWIDLQGREFSRTIFYPRTLLIESLELHAQDIRNILRKNGYDAAVVTVEFQKDAATKKVVPSYQIDLGIQSPDVVVKLIPIEGIELPEPPKPPVYPTELLQYRDQLLKAVQEQGYREGTLSEDREMPNILKVSVNLGPITRAGNIEIKGAQDIPEETIRKLLKVDPGEPLMTQELRAHKQRLLNMGLFSRVDITEIDTQDPKVKNLEVRVFEKPLRTLDIGGGYNTELGVHIFSEGSDRSLFKDGRSLTLRLDAYINSTQTEDVINRGVAALKYTHPSWLDSKFILTEDLRYQKLNAPIQEFDLDRTSLTSNLYRSWDSGISWSFGHTILSETLNNVEPDVVLGSFDFGTVEISYLSTSLTLDKRDNPLTPSTGYSISLDGKIADQTLGSEASFYQTGLRMTNTLPFSIGDNNFAFAQSFRGGLAASLRGDDFVPISQRFYLGGRSTVRGYQENSLGPRGNQGHILGGESLLAGSAEVQYRPVEHLSFNLFLDAGNVYLDNFDPDKYSVPLSLQDEDEAHLRSSTGIGLRFLSPIGPIGFDIGFPLNPREQDSPWRVHFNIGTNF